MKSKAFISKVKSEILKQDRGASIILFGSRARGEERSDSDWDFLIITKKKRDVQLENRIRKSVYEIELEHSQPISTIILNHAEWSSMKITPFYHNVISEGKML